METTLTSTEMVIAPTKVYSSGEKAALSQGKDIVTDEQMAMCYLKATRINVDFGVNLGADLAVETGMHPRTYAKTIKKLWGVENGLEEDEEFTYSEHLCKKILNAHSKLSEMKYDDVLVIAKKAFTDEAKEKGEIKKQNVEDSRKKYAVKKKQNDINIERYLLNTYTELRKHWETEKALKNAISDTAKKFEKKESEVKIVWREMKK